MPLKLLCPNCRSEVRLSEPLPLPGAAIQCDRCAKSIAVTYPAGVIEQLRARGKVFHSPAPPPPRPPTDATPKPAPRSKGTASPSPAPGRDARFLPVETMGTRKPARKPPHAGEAGAVDADAKALDPLDGDSTRVDPTQVGIEAGPRFEEIDRTVPSMRSPYGALANNAAEPEGRLPTIPSNDDPTSLYTDAGVDDDTGTEERGGAARDTGSDMTPTGSKRTSSSKAKKKKGGGAKAVAAGAGCLGSMGAMGVGTIVAVVLVALAVAGGGYWYYSQDLPTIETLRAYSPPTVTVVEDKDGKILGEIFEERRYVVPIEEIPDHVKHAFLSAEDANFYDHGGIDYMGIVRAIGRNALAGRKAQGASTITQQVARNFLLTKDKKIERKIKEIILSWRIEDVYSKDHILFLYLNEISFGSAYGVEAASRTYFEKHVKDITLAEAAILAGLPQRPSDYNPRGNWDKARARQEYVLGQMVAKGHITAAERDQALAEHVKIAAKENKFLDEAPWFTEHVRRYLVSKYGEEAVLNQGLRVRTTCDLSLQTLAQDAVREAVVDTDMRMGWRRTGVKNVGKAGIADTRAAHEKAMRVDWAEDQDAAGRVPVPEKSVLEPGHRYDAVILETNPKWVKVAVGIHEAVVPIAWSTWVYEPDPRRSWRDRVATDLTALVDTDEDNKKDTPILMTGDLVQVTVEALSTRDAAVSKVFANTPGESAPLVAARLFQDTEVESALYSMDLATGAVRALVGGSDFRKSQFNRAVQARRQVGSTFKPIVYAAAIESKNVTAASVFADAALAMATDEEFVWKPSNYSNDFEGNMTVRTALLKSKNTVTVRVLEAADPGMNDDVVYKFARRLGVGGPPTYRLPPDWIPSRTNDLLCPWTRETPDSTICMDRNPPMAEGLTDRQHRAQMKPEDEHWCRACDMSMGLGSASLTMEELVRAYSAFPTGGLLVEPYFIEEVADRTGKILEKHEQTERPRVMEPEVAAVATWLLQGVVHGGTAASAGAELKMTGLGGKTGTTNDEKDAWFVGFSNDVIAAVWTGFDQPRTLGVSSTGGRTSLPTWTRYMKVAAPKERDRSFPMGGKLDWANVDEATGRRITGGGVSYPFLEGTAPESTGLKQGQVSIEDFSGL